MCAGAARLFPLSVTEMNNVIPLFGYCLRGCGNPAVRIEHQANGDKQCLCDNPNCRPRYMPAYCDPNNEVRGAAYDKNLSVKEIAKLMRKAIKAELPGVKVSVRMHGYNCIRMALQEAPGINCEPLVPMQIWYEENPYGRPWKDNFDPQMVALMDRLKDILGRWNRDNSDSMSDYFDVNYYSSLAAPNGMNW